MSVLAALLLLSVLFVVPPPPAVAQNAPEGDPPALVVALESSLSDVGTAASLVAAGKGDAVVFAESADRLGNANSTLVREQMPERVYIVGGIRAVGAGVEARLRSLVPGVSVQRFAGATRVETAALAADEVLSGRSVLKIIVANGWSLPDVGAAAAAVAAGAADAVLYAERGSLGEPTREALSEHRPGTVLIAGGRAALSAEVESSAATAAGGAVTMRLGGATRLETAARIAHEALPGGAATVVIANGWLLDDVGVAATLVAALPNSAVLYAGSSGLLGVASEEALRELDPGRVVVVASIDSIARLLETELRLLGHVEIERVPDPISASAKALGVSVSNAATEPANGTIPICAAEAYMVELVNELRSGLGLRTLLQRDSVATVARQWAETMARQNEFVHNPDFAAQLWKQRNSRRIAVGENIARRTFRADDSGASYFDEAQMRSTVRSLFNQLVNSPPHYDNMTHSDMTEMGVGIAIGNGSMWVTQNFTSYVGAGTVAQDWVHSACETPIVLDADSDYQVICWIDTSNRASCWGQGFQGQFAHEYTNITAGPHHVCAIDIDKSIHCAGHRGIAFNVAFAEQEEVLAPLLEPPEGSFTDLDSGPRHSCAIRTDQTIACWGTDTSMLEVPFGTFRSVAAGAHTTCAIADDLSLECWGDTTENVPSGQFSQVAVGRWYTCGLRLDQSIHCWGDDSFGQLETPESGDFVEVTAGWNHACALAVDRSAVCWGDNTYGQSDAPSGYRFRTLFAGPRHSCGVLINRELQCWGDHYHIHYYNNNYIRPPWYVGPTRSITITTQNDITQLASSIFSGSLCWLEADGAAKCQRSSGGTAGGWDRGDRILELHAPPGQFRQIDVGGEYWCGIKENRGVSCFGPKNYGGELEPPSDAFVSISTNSRSVCGITTRSEIVCWGGRTGSGQIQSLVTDVPSGKFMALDTGNGAACAVRTDGSLQCWGNDYYLATPRGSFVSVSMGTWHACALRIDNSIACWGRNPSGQLDAPRGYDFVAIDSGPLHVCALRRNGAVVCWGNSDNGRLDVPSGMKYTAIVAFSGNSCGLANERRLDCWGAGF